MGKEDARHLWPEMLRIIREVQPCYVVGENVRGLLSWNGGVVFDEVQADLEAEGFTVLPFLLPACGIDAPHRRDRIWFIAHSASIGEREQINKISTITESREARTKFSGIGRGRSSTNAISDGSQRGSALFNPWGNFPTQSPLCRRDDGISNIVDRVTALGNAIVPQVAFEVFKALEQAHEHHTTSKN
jgi:DNA (cytosine-5)-methyltransferase 1